MPSARPTPNPAPICTASPAPSLRLAAKIHSARDLALNGAAGPARALCGAIFLEHLPTLARDATLLAEYVECLLLLEMMVLLPRVIRAIHGVRLEITPMSDRLAGPGGRRWRLRFGTGVTLPMSAPGRLERLQSAERWRHIILAEAAREPDTAPGEMARELEPAL